MPTLEVLCPNGHRVKVTVTPNTTMQQVLEEVCSAQNLSLSSYYLRHNRKPLDLTASFRFSNLINMSKLELMPLETGEGVSGPMKPNPSGTAGVSAGGDKIRVAVQFATTGERMMLPEVDPCTTLWSILEQCGKDEDSVKQICFPQQAQKAPMLLYLAQKVAGEEALKSCTLRSLGVLKGSALLKYDQIDPSEVSAVTPASAVPVVKCPVPSPSQGNLATTDAQPPSTEQEKMDIQETGEASYTASGSYAVEDEQQPAWPQRSVFAAPVTKSMFLQEQDERGERSRRVKSEQKSMTIGEMLGISLEGIGRSSADNAQSAEFANFKFPDRPLVEQEENDVYRDTIEPVDHQPIWFHLDSIPTSTRPPGEDNDPDEVYEVTIEDVRRMAALYREALEEKPLMTEALRQAQREKLFHKYKSCVIQFHFANRLVLQCLFHPKELLQSAFDYLQTQTAGVTVSEIYITPPKRVFSKTDLSTTLLQLNLVPLSKVYVSLKEMSDLEVLKSKITCRSYAEAVTIVQQSLLSSTAEKTTDSVKNEVAKTAKDSRSGTQNSIPHSGAPKWFKPTTK